jgi:hypothetical protein
MKKITSMCLDLAVLSRYAVPVAPTMPLSRGVPATNQAGMRSISGNVPDSALLPPVFTGPLPRGKCRHGTRLLVVQLLSPSQDGYSLVFTIHLGHHTAPKDTSSKSELHEYIAVIVFTASHHICGARSTISRCRNYQRALIRSLLFFIINEKLCTHSGTRYSSCYIIAHARGFLCLQLSLLTVGSCVMSFNSTVLPRWQDEEARLRVQTPNCLLFR